MKLVCAVLFAVAFASFAEGRFLVNFQAFKDDPLELLRQVLFYTNSKIADNGMSTYDFPKFKFSFFLLDMKLSNGHVGNLSTLELVGGPQKWNMVKVSDQVTRFDFDVTVGFKDLGLDAEVDYSLLFLSSASNWEVLMRGNAFNFKGSITASKDSCQVVFENAGVKTLGDVKINITPDNTISSLIGSVLQYALDLGVLVAEGAINQFSKSLVDSNQSMLSDLICTTFHQ